MNVQQFVRHYCEASCISEDEFYKHFIPMPDENAPDGWAAVSNIPCAIKAHVNLNMVPDRMPRPWTPADMVYD